MQVETISDKYYKQVDTIYEQSFPVDERYMPLLEMIEAENTELHCLTDDDNVYGFIYTIIHNQSVFILYLAIFCIKLLTFV